MDTRRIYIELADELLYMLMFETKILTFGENYAKQWTALLN